jgi:hypothetical protein
VNPIVVSAAATGIGGGAEQVRESRTEVANAQTGDGALESATLYVGPMSPFASA